MSVCAINDKLMFVCFLAIVLFSEILPPVNVHTIMIFASTCPQTQPENFCSVSPVLQSPTDIWYTIQ